MELGVRDWMIIIGVLLIVAVLLDGYRRMRNERRGNIRISLNKQFLNTVDNEEEITSELPSGGARVVDKRQSAASGSRSAFSERKSSDSELDLEQSVPMLMESVAEQTDILLDGYEDDAFDQHYSPDPVVVEEEAKSHDEPSTTQPAAEIEEVVVINVLAKNEPFKGPDLLHILLACDLRFGDRNIFHRFEEANGRGAIQFSVANSVEPGIFDLDTIDDFTTPGVCFFMSVPGPKQSIKAFECMVETAQCLVTNLDGELLDDSRSAMTNQTLEHCRLRLQEYERRQLTQHA